MDEMTDREYFELLAKDTTLDLMTRRHYAEQARRLREEEGGLRALAPMRRYLASLDLEAR